jgi:hypothetical protein
VNPFVDHVPYGTCEIGGTLVAGIIQSITGFEKIESWDFQKGTDSSGETSVWKGTLLAKGGKIVTKLITPEQYDAFNAHRAILRPKLGTKPPSLAVVNAKINGNGVTVIVTVSAPEPDWVEGGNYYLGTITAAEYNPSKKTNTGKASAAKSNPEDDAAKTANDEAFEAYQKALNEAKAAGNGTPKNP